MPETTTLRDRASGCLLGVFVGDALGAAWEGAAPLDSRSGRERVASALLGAPLAYTDDTQLTIALAEHLLDHPTGDAQAFADLALEHIETWRGYGAGMLRLVDHWRLRVPVEQAAVAVFPDGSFGNGAAMRVAPVGVLWHHDPQRAAEVARVQARATHVHPIGQDGAVVQATAVARATATGAFGRDDLTAIASIASTGEARAGLTAAATWAERWGRDRTILLTEVAEALGTGVAAHRSVPAALWAAAVSVDVGEAVHLALGLGGDTDTIAAMAAGVRGAAGGRASVPQQWQAALVDDRRGRTYVIDLARRLANASGVLVAGG